MFFITFKRILRAGWLSFHRNGWLSMATITIMILVLFVMGNLLFVSALSETILGTLETKIDISVYFARDAGENEILMVKRELEALPNVAGVAYVSRDKALEQFRERHKTNALIADALAELGENPLEASLNIRARDPSQYSSISEFLLEKNYPIVDKINYFENQQVIDRFSAIMGTVRGTGAFAAFLLAFVAVLVAFNTIRIGIYTMREEIGIMRLVGAMNWFIRGPFVVTGVLYGVSSAVITTLLFFPITWVLAPKIALAIPGFNVFHYFLSNVFGFFSIMLFVGLSLGVLSSMIAVRRYLKI